MCLHDTNRKLLSGWVNFTFKNFGSYLHSLKVGPVASDGGRPPIPYLKDPLRNDRGLILCCL